MDSAASRCLTTQTSCYCLQQKNMKSLPALLGKQDALLIVSFAKSDFNPDDGVPSLLLGFIAWLSRT